MSNIIVDYNAPIQDGTEVVFRSPVDCSQVTGLKVNYNGDSKEFMFADAHGNNVGDIDHLFAENVVVKVILDVTTGMAFVQNADTNAYLEGRFSELERMIGAGGGSSEHAVLYTEQTITDEQKSQARENIGAANGEIEVFFKKEASANLFNINDPNAFYGRIGGSGNLIDTDIYFTTGFIGIQPGETLYLTRHSTGEKKAVSILTVEVYSAEKIEIERVQLGLSTYIYNCTNESARFVRIVFRSEYLQNDIMIAKSQDAKYVKYGHTIEFSEKAKQEVQKQIGETSSILGNELEWEIGTINNEGQNADTTTNAKKRIRTKGYIFLPKGSVLLSDTPNFAVHLYEQDKTFVPGSITDWIQEYIMPDDYYVRILIRKDSSNSEINPDEIDAIAEKIKLKIIWDTILLPEIIAGDSVSDYVDVPEYFREMLPTKISQIVENMANAGNHGETFIFITDLHWGHNFKNSPALVKKVIEKTGIKLFLCGGDLFQDGDKQTMIDLTIDLLNNFRTPDVLMPIAFGNHDSNTLNSTGDENIARTWSFDTVFGIIQKRFSSDVHYFSEDKCNFYFDRTDSKTRFIVLDTGTDGAYDRYAEFAEVLNSTPNGYHIIIVQHWIVTAVASNPAFTTHSRIMMNIINSYNERKIVGVYGTGYDFTNAQGTIEFFLGGHTHFDCDFGIDHAENQSGVWIAMTDSDAYIGHESENTKDTAQSQCFDVITVDYNNKTVKCVRIGRGENRYYSYNPESYGMLAQ